MEERDFLDHCGNSSTMAIERYLSFLWLTALKSTFPIYSRFKDQLYRNCFVPQMEYKILMCMITNCKVSVIILCSKKHARLFLLFVLVTFSFLCESPFSVQPGFLVDWNFFSTDYTGLFQSKREVFAFRKLYATIANVLHSE